MRKVIIRKMKRIELTNALDLQNVSIHSMERMVRVYAVGGELGECVDGFIVKDKKHGKAEHFITSTGVELIRGYKSHTLITVTIPSVSTVRKYYETLGDKAPEELLEVVQKAKAAFRKWETSQKKVARY